MKNFLLFAVLLFTSAAIHAQNDPAPTVISTQKHKVVIQLTSGDTLVQKAVIKQITHLLDAAPNSKIEVVCHSNGISFLQLSLTKQADGIRRLKARGVDFVACENSMRDRKLKREDLVAECRTVPVGVLEIIMKQEKHWAYLKAGF